MASGAITSALTPLINAPGSSEPSAPVAPALSAPSSGIGAQPLSPGVSPTSSRFPNNSHYIISPKLPPILPAHIPKNVSLNTGLMSTRRSISPARQSLAVEGTSQNPAAVLRNSSPGISRITDGPPLTAAKATSIDTRVAGDATRPPLPTPTSGNEGKNVAADGVSMNIDASAAPATSPQTTTSPNDLSAVLEKTPARPTLGSISDSITPSTFQQAAPSTPFSPGGSENRGSMSSILDSRGSVSSTGGSRARHECPNCHQTFTRHHNLKSHLLTHSHEKPFQCVQCHSRFRRLHDLKRHQKLHTGERPHECRSCGRKFARGDALARHLRGEGGCAGRRNSMGGLGEDNYDPNDEGMDLEMSPVGELDDEMPDFHDTPSRSNSTRRTTSLPNARSRRRSSNRVPTMGAPQGHYQAPNAPMDHRTSQHHPTYPPPSFAQGPTSAGLSTPSTATSGSLTSNTITSTAPSTIMSSTLTDSPRALSPSNPAVGLPDGNFSLNRTSSSTSVHQQALENRRRSNASISGPGLNLPQPNSLPSLGGPKHAPPSTTRTHSSSLPVPSRPTAFTDGVPAGLGNIFASGEEGMWAYIQNMEKRIRDLEEKNNHLEARVAALSAERQPVSQQQLPPALQDSAPSTTTNTREAVPAT